MYSTTPCIEPDESGLAIISPTFKPIYVSDIYAKLRVRLKNLNQNLLIQATKLKTKLPTTVWDLTAGLGMDAILMANFGYKVTMVEQNPTLVTILRYALTNELIPNCYNLNLVHANSLEFLLQEHENFPDIIYLDPMFRDKKSAKSKKAMQIIELLTSAAEISEDIEDAENKKLFHMATLYAKYKVIVKRDNKGSVLVDFPKPDYVKMGKTVRYDVYLKH